MRPQTAARQASREERLVAALDGLMEHSPDVQAAALVSLDGFTMASALPEGMQEDRVGAMSAAILGLGERAATELGRGHLSQVFIEGADGYVLLMAAGDRAVLTALSAPGSKLGLVLYDMRETAGAIGDILR
ncbi:MAG: roadblock/LC7 domain-containing protein [Coriobacteriia bacterium]|nr:roadblock/LC7 domain-containing protein [Coriobacteriia bacterium]